MPFESHSVTISLAHRSDDRSGVASYRPGISRVKVPGEPIRYDATGRAAWTHPRSSDGREAKLRPQGGAERVERLEAERFVG
jgi:hypothetical protein